MKDSSVPPTSGGFGPQRMTLGRPLTVSRQFYGATEVLVVSGEVDLKTVTRLRQAITAALRAAPSVLVVDMDEVEYLDSAGLNALVDAQERLDGRSELRVVASHRVTLRPLQLTGLDQVLTICASRDEALSLD
jgi:anti-sigma B factor antagonist